MLPISKKTLREILTGHKRLKQKTKAVREVSDAINREEPSGAVDPRLSTRPACGPGRGRGTPHSLFYLPSRAGGMY